MSKFLDVAVHCILVSAQYNHRMLMIYLADTEDVLQYVY